jgi:phage head maturation protease
MIRKALTTEFVPSASGFTAVISTDALDRDCEVVQPDGMNSVDYERNPVLLWNHEQTSPIGRCLGLVRKANAIIGEFEFAKRPEGFQGEFFPDFVAALVGQGIVKGTSIQYIPEPNGTRRANDADLKKYGSQLKTVYSRWKLLEVSVAPLQANPDALVTAVRKGFVSAKAAETYLGYKPTRTQIVVILPAATSSPKRSKSIDLASVVRAEFARATGRLTI